MYSETPPQLDRSSIINSSSNDQMSSRSKISTCVQIKGHFDHKFTKFDHKFTNYAGIMLTALRGLLCSKQCRHNVLVPIYLALSSQTVAFFSLSCAFCSCFNRSKYPCFGGNITLPPISLASRCVPVCSSTSYYMHLDYQLEQGALIASKISSQKMA